MPPPPPPSQPPARRRHLTADERAAIAEARAQGVRVQDLARRWGVSRQTIHATLKGVPSGGQEGTQAAPARRSPTVSVRLSIKELRELDATAALWGVSRPEALRRLVREVEVILAPDRTAAAQLASMSAAVREAGVRVNQIARACNEAQLRRQPIPYTVQHDAQVRQAVAVVFDTVLQVQALAVAGRARLDATTAAALGTKGKLRDAP